MGERLRTIRHEIYVGFRTLQRSIVWQLLAQQRRWLLALFVGGVITGTFVILNVLTIRDLVDDALIDKTEPLDGFVTALGFYAVCIFVSGLVVRQVGARMGYHLEYQLRLWLYGRLQGTDPRVLDTMSTGQIITRSLTDLALLEAIILVLPGIGLGLIALLALSGYLLIANPLMGVVAMAAIPVNYAIIIRVRERLWGLSWLVLNRRAEVTTSIDEPVRGMRVVKAFGREQHERQRVAEAARRTFAVSVNRVRTVAKYDLILLAMPAILNAALLFIGGRQVSSGQLTVGDMLIFFALAAVFTGFASSFDEILSGWTFAGTGAGRIFELASGMRPAGSDALADTDDGSGLVYDGVSLELGGVEVLSDVDLRVDTGELTVVNGPPGSGKSVLASLALGGLVPTSGAISLDGADLAAASPLAVRRRVRVLPEDPFLFGRTVRENLTVGITDLVASDEELWTALEVASAAEFVRQLDGGLDAVLGDRGLTLSGGQRQRLALARSIVHPPRVLVLDDALSAVNPSLEVEIMRRVRDHTAGSAILAVSRRDALAEIADAVVTLPPPSAIPQRPQAEAGIEDEPMSEALARAVEAVPADRDDPEIDDDAARDDSEPPSVRNVLGPVSRRAAIAAGLLLLLTLAQLIPNGLIQPAIDDFARREHGTADRVVVAITLVGFVIGALSFAFKVAAAKVSEGVMYLLRRRTIQRLSRLGIDYYDRELPGQVASRVVHDLDKINEFLDRGVYVIVSSIALLLGTVAILFVWSPPVAVIVSAFVAVAIVATVVQVPLAARAYLRQRIALGDVVTRFQEDLAGRHVIHSFGAEKVALDAFDETSWALRTARRTATTIANVYIESIQLIMNLATMALLATAGALALDETLTLGSVVALQLYLIKALEPIPLLSGVLQKYLAARTSFQTLAMPFQAEVLPVERPSTAPVASLSGALEFEGVRFRYPGTDRFVLDGVDLQIAAGSVVAVVGPTGAGKSTIAKLAARIYDPDAGAVLAELDGQGERDLRDLDLDDFRTRLGIVPQDAFCFRGTVADNVRYGRPTATLGELKDAAEAVGAIDEIERMGGWDTDVEEEGRNLTAGQRQFIALARAVLRHPDILILDEATSSLDAAAEAALLDAVRDLGRTTIMVTHRLPVAEIADHILVVDRGEVVQQGTHDELMAAGGAYAALWSRGADIELAGVIGS